MSISDTQFSAWLAGDNPRVLLWEQKFAYGSGGPPVEGTAYFSTVPYATGASDTPANQPYRARISKTPNIARSINPDSLGGMTAISVGGVTLDNADGEVDFLSDLILDGREAKFLLGAPQGTPGWSRSDFRTVLVALAEVADGFDDMSLSVMLRDQRLLLDKAIAGDVVNDERRKPLLFNVGAGAAQGRCYSVEPVQKSAADLTYYVLQNYNASADVYQVYDNGLPLAADINSPLWGENNAGFTANAGTETLTRVAHSLSVNDVVVFGNPGPTFPGSIFAGLSCGPEYWVIAAGLTADDFRLSLTKGGTAVNITGTTFGDAVYISRGRVFTDLVTVDGTIQLSSTPAGRLTVDASGKSASQVDSATGDLIRALLIDYGGFPSGSIDSSLAAADSGIYLNYTRTGIAVLERENLLDVLDAISRVAQVWWGPDHLGVIRGGRLDLSALSDAPATRSLGENDVFAAPRVSNRRAVVGTVGLRSQRNYRPLSYGEFAGAVTTANRTIFAAQFRAMRENAAPTGTAYSGNWQGFYKSAVRAEFDGGFATESGELAGMADEIIGDLKPHIKTIEVQTDLRAYEWLLGDVVTFTYRRHGFTAGKKCRLISISTDFAAERVNLTLLTQTTPDYASASH